MGRSQDKLEKMQLRQSYRNVWQSDLMSTVTADTPYCCFSFEEFFQVFLCFGNSVASTRFMLQDEFNIHTTQCDNCIIGFMFCLNQIACIFSLVACIVGSDELSEASQLLSCLADMVYCTYTQHKIEMDKRDGVLGSQPMSVPPAQQMSRVDQPTPPYAGYPPATGYPQPYYPQPGHGYPPAPGYPPPGHGYPPAPGYPPPGHGYPPAPGYPPPGHGYPPAPDYPSK
ncbi:hypothetical protein Bca52824_046429 [Brassica carinata]|uniref:Rhodopsin n=1 Tax=Brassica carinata TaxID=52824 RepID=A0A8X7RH87_BRACI|nr:hypothetical protein Bca52824_046429 [Brassica carinata]